MAYQDAATRALELERLTAFISRADFDNSAQTWARRISAGRIRPTDRINAEDCLRFARVVEAELMSLHEGNFARYQIRPSEFVAWRAVWEST